MVSLRETFARDSRKLAAYDRLVNNVPDPGQDVDAIENAIRFLKGSNPAKKPPVPVA